MNCLRMGFLLKSHYCLVMRKSKGNFSALIAVLPNGNVISIITCTAVWHHLNGSFSALGYHVAWTLETTSGNDFSSQYQHCFLNVKQLLFFLLMLQWTINLFTCINNFSNCNNPDFELKSLLVLSLCLQYNHWGQVCSENFLPHRGNASILKTSCSCYRSFWDTRTRVCMLWLPFVYYICLAISINANPLVVLHFSNFWLPDFWLRNQKDMHFGVSEGIIWVGIFLEVWGIFSVLVQLLFFPCYTQTMGNARKLKNSEFLIDAMLP